jgi:hypothetical protein
MKTREPSTVTSPKRPKKQNNFLEESAPFSPTSPNRHNSAINLKLVKEKSKTKKENKDKKSEGRGEDKKTKRKERKKQNS